jgi:excisionase family DNA binding protein
MSLITLFMRVLPVGESAGRRHFGLRPMSPNPARFHPVSGRTFDKCLTKTANQHVDFIDFVADSDFVTMTTVETDLLTTGEVAKLLGVTTQHVRNLCDRGLLPYVHVGSHRRVRQSEFEALKSRQEGGLLREQVHTIWLHQAVAGKLVSNPDRVLKIARRNLQKLRRAHPTGSITQQFDEWERLLNGSFVNLLNSLTSTAPHAIELRQNTPFAGVLSERERQQVLDSFRSSYRRRDFNE